MTLAEKLRRSTDAEMASALVGIFEGFSAAQKVLGFTLSEHMMLDYLQNTHYSDSGEDNEKPEAV